MLPWTCAMAALQRPGLVLSLPSVRDAAYLVPHSILMGLLGFHPWAVAEHFDRGFGKQWIDSGELDGVRENMLGSCFGVSRIFLQSITRVQHGMGRPCISQNRTLSYQQSWWYEVLMVNWLQDI